MVHEQMIRFYSGSAAIAHPMAVMVGVVGALSAFYHDSIDIKDPAQREMASIRMIAKMPTLAAMAYKYSIGQPFIYPRNELKYSANFLHMLLCRAKRGIRGRPALASAMRQFFILHADHEQSASTATVRLAGSSGATPMPASQRHCLSLGTCTRRCHRGGAADVEGDRHGRPHPGIHQARQGRERSVPTHGFGYRVYKTYDQERRIMRKALHEVLENCGRHRRDDPLFKVAVELERIALSDDYFVEKSLVHISTSIRRSR